MSKKKQHITLDPVYNSRYLRRHGDKLGKLPKKVAARQDTESFLDRREK